MQLTSGAATIWFTALTRALGERAAEEPLAGGQLGDPGTEIPLGGGEFGAVEGSIHLIQY